MHRLTAVAAAPTTMMVASQMSSPDRPTYDDEDDDAQLPPRRPTYGRHHYYCFHYLIIIMPPLSLFVLLMLPPQPTTSLHQNSYTNHTFTLPLSLHTLARSLTHSPPTPGQINNIAARPNVDDDHRLPATVVMMMVRIKEGRLVQEKAPQPIIPRKRLQGATLGTPKTRKPKQKPKSLFSTQPTSPSPPNQIRPVGCLVSLFLSSPQQPDHGSPLPPNPPTHPTNPA